MPRNWKDRNTVAGRKNHQIYPDSRTDSSYLELLGSWAASTALMWTVLACWPRRTCTSRILHGAALCNLDRLPNAGKQNTQSRVRRLTNCTPGVTSSTLKTSRPDQILCSALRFSPGQPGYRRRLRTVDNRGRRGSLTLLFDRRRNSVGHFDAVAFLLQHLLSNGPLHRKEITYLNWSVKDSYWTLSRIKYRLKSLVSASLSHFSS